MRIGLIAPISEPVPPPGYGGIELVVDMLARHLSERGHDVLLFAAGDSRCPVPLVSTEPLALRVLGHDSNSTHVTEAVHLAHAMGHRQRIDLFHNHLGVLGVAFGQACDVPMLTTLHGPLDADAERRLQAFPGHPFVAISRTQREGIDLRFAGTVYNGIEVERFQPGAKQDYLLFLGRLSPEKGPHLAIAVAKEAGIPLVLAGKVDPFDRAYFEATLAPEIDGTRVRYIGEVGGQAKRELLSGAIALLHMVQWPEPFGLVMVEALASGTPVIALPYGAIPEVVEHGRCGFVVSDVPEAVASIRRLGALDPAECRRSAVRRFSATRMVEDYLAVYEAILRPRACVG